MGLIPSYGTEAHIYARYILKHLPNAKVAVLYQNDDFGKDYLDGLRDGLGDKAAKMIVATQSYETTSSPELGFRQPWLRSLAWPPPPMASG
jgi:branched-chain amino acid transport system substrate-binding protein